MLTRNQKSIKRIFDLIFSIIITPVVIGPLVILIVIATISTGHYGVFSQTRVGQHGKLFKMFKIRSLQGNNHVDINELKASTTYFGSWLRRTKLDELPQILNVLKGNMSWVGPRPDLPGYADRLIGEDRIILEVKPGITGPATLKYKNEEQLLLIQEDAIEYNDRVIWPDKVEINKRYIQNWSLKTDISILIQSL